MHTLNFIGKITPLTFCGITILLGLIGGEVTRIIRFIPKISGYIAVGFLVGPNVLNIVTNEIIADIRIFADISIGLILFNLGRQLEFKWLKNDKSLLCMSFAESGLTFLLIFVAFSLLNFSFLSATFAATIAMTTSPAVIMLIVNDLSSEGPVTRRALMLTSLNNLWGLILFMLLISIANQNITDGSYIELVKNYSYKLLGVIALATSLFMASIFISKIIGKQKQNQVILFIGLILLAISLATKFNLSIKFSLFIFGIIVRNFDKKYSLTVIDFEWGLRVAFILLFVITGMQISLHGLATSSAAVMSFLLLRTIAKTSGIWMYAKKSRVTPQQVLALSLALTPMAGVTVGMLNTLTDFHQDIGLQLTHVIVPVVAILHILGPIATQYAFIKSNEVGVIKQ